MVSFRYRWDEDINTSPINFIYILIWKSENPFQWSNLEGDLIMSVNPPGVAADKEAGVSVYL